MTVHGLRVRNKFRSESNPPSRPDFNNLRTYFALFDVSTIWKVFVKQSTTKKESAIIQKLQWNFWWKIETRARQFHEKKKTCNVDALVCGLQFTYIDLTATEVTFEYFAKCSALFEVGCWLLFYVRYKSQIILRNFRYRAFLRSPKIK